MTTPQPRGAGCQDDGGVFLAFKSSVNAQLTADGANVTVKVVDNNGRHTVEMNAGFFAAMCEVFIETVKPQIGTPSTL